MSLAALGSLLEAVPQYKQLSRLLRETRANARVQVVEDAVPFLLSTLWQHLGAPMLVIAPRPEEARRLYEQMAVWAGGGCPGPPLSRNGDAALRAAGVRHAYGP